MNIEVNLNNLTKEEQEQFNALVEKANKSKSKAWKPEEEKQYYCIEAGGKIKNFKYISAFDKFNYTMGNCFKTREEAEFALERLKVIAEMKHYIAEHDDVELDWNSCEQEKYYILYYYDTDSIDIDYFRQTQFVDNSLYASSEEILENMIKEIGEDRIKKYYFGVE